MLFSTEQVIPWTGDAEGIQVIREKLREIPELAVFHDNQPQFMILSLERLEEYYRRRAVPEDMVPEVLQDTEEDVMKIGAFARKNFRMLFRMERLSAADVKNLQDRRYCKEQFRFRMPVLKRFDPQQSMREQRVDTAGYNRYYDEIFTIYGERYLLSNDWVERHRIPLQQWLNRVAR